MARGVGIFGKSLLSVSVLALLAISGCGQVSVTENAASSSSDGTDSSGGSGSGTTDPTTGTDDGSGSGSGSGDSGSGGTESDSGSGSSPTEAIGDTETVTANQDVLTHTQTTVYNLNSNVLGVGGWQPTGLLESSYDDATSPRVVFDASGNGFATWTQGSDALVSRYTATSATWSSPQALDASSEQANQTRIAIDRDTGNAIVGWTQSDGTAESFYVSRYDASTGSWSSPQVLESSNNAVESGQENSNVTIRGDQAAAAWRQSDGTNINVYLSRLVNGSWTTPVVVDTSTQPALHPDLQTDNSGNVILVWRQYDGEYRIHSRRWNNSTQSFNAVVQLDGDGDRQPRLGMDSSGNAFALWRGGGIYVRRFDATTGQWGSQVTVDAQTGDPRVGELSVDDDGNAIAAWVENDSTGQSVYTRRYDAATASWGSVELMENSTDEVNVDKNPTVSINGEEAVVAWVQNSSESDDNVYARKLSGGVWGDITSLETRDERADELFSTVNAAGNAAVVWIQADGAAPSVYQAIYRSANFVVPNGATWQSLAYTLYGVDSVEAGNALQAALGGGTLMSGSILTSLPSTLTVTTTVDAYYTVLSTDTWSHIAQKVYGVTDVNAIAQLQALLGTTTLSTGAHLVVPTSYSYVVSGNYSAPLNWDEVHNTSTSYYALNTSQLTIPLTDWDAAQLLESDYSDASTPHIGFDASGNGIAVWAQSSDIIARRYDAATGTWGDPVTLDTNTHDAHAPVLAIDRSSGNAVVSWAQSDGIAESQYVSSFAAATSSWSTAETIDNLGYDASQWPEGSAVSIAGSYAAVAWLQSDGTNTNIYLSRLVNGSWTTAALIDTTNDDEAQQPAVAVDSNGNVTVLWRQYANTYGESRILSRRWNNSSESYGSVTPIDDDGDRRPRIAFDSAGNGFALWGGGAYARRYDVTSGTWGSQVQLHTSEDGAWNGEIAVDAAGNALAAWVQNDGTANSVYARYYDSTTQSWGSAVSLESANTSASVDQNLTVSLVDGYGVVAWIQENTNSQDVYAARFASGVWGAATLLESRDEQPSELASSVDGDSNATVVWIQADGAAPSVYAARSNGTPYYLVPSGATWNSVAYTLYGVDSDDAADALQAAMGNPALTAGSHLVSPPSTLAVTPDVPTYYVVETGDTWASITLALYGTSATEAVTALQTYLGNPSLTVDSWLLVPSTLEYSVTE